MQFMQNGFRLLFGTVLHLLCALAVCVATSKERCSIARYILCDMCSTCGISHHRAHVCQICIGHTCVTFASGQPRVLILQFWDKDG